MNNCYFRKMHYLDLNHLNHELVFQVKLLDLNRKFDIDYSLVIAPVVAELCTTSVVLSAPPNSYQNNSQS